MATPILPDHAHGTTYAPTEVSDQGRFNWLFRKADIVPADSKLEELASTMYKTPASAPQAEAIDDSAIPAGYTYLAQFIDHDLSFDPVSSLRKRNDLRNLPDLRSPRFDLDALYGSGPIEQPYLYTFSEDDQGNRVIRMLLGRVLGTLTDKPDITTPRDVPRNVLVESDNSRPSFSQPAGRALIGDPRNDEHVIISQLHAVFLRFHNCLADDLKAEEEKEPEFERVQNMVRWHYQWIVLYDFLRRIINPDTYDAILPHVKAKTAVAKNPPKTPNYDAQGGAYIPVEFADAAYRYGHSMIRGQYRLNGSGIQGIGGPFPILSKDLQSGLTGLRAFPDTWVIDWGHFFDGLPSSQGQNPQKALKINTFLAPPLEQLPPSIIAADGPDSLAERDLRRGRSVDVKTGQEIAHALKVNAMSDGELFANRPDLAKAFTNNTPLWYYVLAEAEQQNQGERLGEVGGRIVMETMVGLMMADANSILRKAADFLPRRAYRNADEEFRMQELIKAAHADQPPQVLG
jgi:hypothetical protein